MILPPPSPPASGTRSPHEALLFQALLSGVPDYIYFKDRESRFIAASDSLVRAFGKTSETEVIGRTDFDFYAEEHARPAYDDEQKIIRTGEPMYDKLEKEYWPTGRVTYVLTTKLPLRDADGAIIGTYGISKDVTAQKKLEIDLERANRDLVEASRAAGMAEVATGVLHNVGNVLNSLNVSASVIANGLRQSKTESLSRAVALINEHANDLGAFLTNDPKGKRVPEFLASLANHAQQERDRLLLEFEGLQKNIDHIKEIVGMQQAYATMVGVVEPLDPAALVEDAIRMNAGALIRHEVRVVRDFQPTPKIIGEQAKVLQILINLIRNAKYACDEGGSADKCITLRILPHGTDRVHIVVQDNGVGIPPENLAKMFQHGFTTRPNGHGFGLHSALKAARDMKGTIFAQSEGLGKGASFIVDVPAAHDPAPMAS
jgi:PAS domain S-box-containing protein